MSIIQTFFNTHKPKSTPRIFDLVLQQIDDKGGVGLDICCGTGRLAVLIRERGYDCIGIDISAEFIGKSGQGATGFVVGDISKGLPFSNQCVRLVTCIDSLQYFADPEALIVEIMRVLQPGGTLILSCQNNYNFTGLKRGIIEKLTGKTWSPWLVHPVENHITYPWLIACLQRNGLRVSYVRGRQFLTAWVGLLPSFIRNWSPWRDKPWRSPASVAQRVNLPEWFEESILARFAMIVFVRAQKP